MLPQTSPFEGIIPLAGTNSDPFGHDLDRKATDFRTRFMPTYMSAGADKPPVCDLTWRVIASDTVANISNALLALVDKPARKPHGRRVVPRCCRIRGMDATTLKGCPLRRV